MTRLFKHSIFVILIFVGACTERMDLDQGELSVYLVVEATITNEVKAHQVKLSRTKLLMDTVIPPISNAYVSISDGVNEVVLTESDTLPGLYLTPDNYFAEEGNTYTLQVGNVDIDNDGVLESYTGSSVMPSYIPVDSVTAERFVFDLFEMSGWWLKCWAWDPPDENFYMFKAWKNDTLLSDTLYEIQFTDDALFNGQFTNGIECAFLDDKETDEFVRIGDKLTLEMCHITEEFFNYMVGTIIESGYKVPMFSGPPANVPSNMSDGAVGFFRVYYTVKMSDIAAVDDD